LEYNHYTSPKNRRFNYHTKLKKRKIEIRKSSIQLDFIIRNNRKKIFKIEKVVIKDVCVICCKSTKNLQYINCKKGGIQNFCFGKYEECCKDKPICNKCKIRCYSKCPFCTDHNLKDLKTKRYPKKKPSFIERQKILYEKKLKKERKKKRERMKKEREKSIQNEVTLSFPDLNCSYCGSSIILFNEVQTPIADATNIICFTCHNCFFR